jgi:N6-adenosine-specific RNA methylase IME4
MINKITIRKGQQALERLNAYQKQAWTDWRTTGAALLELHQEAKSVAGGKDRGRGYNTEYSRLLKNHHFDEKYLTETTRISLLHIMRNLEKVEKWRNEQPDPDALNHPVYVWNEYNGKTGSADDIVQTARNILKNRAVARRAKERQKILQNTTVPTPLENIQKRYPVILADPPWQFEAFNPTHNKSVQKHYDVMPIVEICEMPVGALTTPDAMLFLWTPNALLPDALKVIEAWGFKYSTNMIWEKENRIGLGYYVRNTHEMLLIARKGNIPVPEPENRPISMFRAPWRGHSVKPDMVIGRTNNTKLQENGGRTNFVRY